MPEPHIGFECRAWARPEWNDIGVWLCRRFPSGDVAMAEAVFETADPHTATGPTFKLSREEAQLLANTLWDAGIRATQSSGSMGQVEAMRNHIQDLRDELSRMHRLASMYSARIERSGGPLTVPVMIGGDPPAKPFAAGGIIPGPERPPLQDR